MRDRRSTDWAIRSLHKIDQKKVTLNCVYNLAFKSNMKLELFFEKHYLLFWYLIEYQDTSLTFIFIVFINWGDQRFSKTFFKIQFIPQSMCASYVKGEKGEGGFWSKRNRSITRGDKTYFKQKWTKNAFKSTRSAMGCTSPADRTALKATGCGMVQPTCTIAFWA